MDIITHYITAERVMREHDDMDEGFKRGLKFGCLGPDIFFFGLTRLHGFANAVHDGNARRLFANINLLGREGFGAGYAYGVMLHYFGDRAVHPYIAALCAEDAQREGRVRKAAHVEYETKIEKLAYYREYGEDISSFPFRKVFEYDAAVVDEIADFWRMRYPNARITKAIVRRMLARMRILTPIFIKPRKLTIFLGRLADKLVGYPGAATTHFKLYDDESVMNDARAPWAAPNGETETASVGDIMDKTVADFEREFASVQKLEKNAPYTFPYTETFSNGT